jgi:hypothetical protein
VNERLGDVRWLELLRTHHAIVRDQVHDHGGRRRLSVSVSQVEHEPALDAVAFALGLEMPVQRPT